MIFGWFILKSSKSVKKLTDNYCKYSYPKQKNITFENSKLFVNKEQ